MKPLENKYFVAVHARRAGTTASTIAEIFVCLMRAPRLIVAGMAKVASDMTGL
ncbi:hypothetical protein [Steroidobacter agaridevorans]|uniref:hypothetical protein n=1 Tax=Steroidobacter agaridevorans TaxID=2695856 RepID=UPI00137A7B07|nr:hypothetical protein [Steroidobacter agaridevorans]